MDAELTEDERYFDHDADIGVIGRGVDVEKCFSNAAYNMFSIMTDLSKINPQQIIAIDFVEDDLEFAFVTWLNLLLAKAREHQLVFSEFSLEHKDNQWHGKAKGEPWRENIERGIEVKGATLTMLSVKKLNHVWEARCVVDV